MAFYFPWLNTCIIYRKVVKLDQTHPQEDWIGNMHDKCCIEYAFHFNQDYIYAYLKNKL
jgi:hypothetical protein